MASYLRYTGKTPVHALKDVWNRGSQKTLQDLFRQFGNKCKVTDKMDSTFVQWVFNTYIKDLGNEFEFVVSKADLEGDAPTVLPVEERASETKKGGKINVESDKVEVGKSVEDAASKLTQMRSNDNDNNGIVERNKEVVKTNTMKSQHIAELPKPGENVMTGDDLLNETNISSSTGTSLVLNEVGQTTKVIPTIKEEQDRINSKMSSANSTVKVIHEEVSEPTSVESRVMVGGDSPNVSTEALFKTVDNEDAASVLDEDPKAGKVNKNFQGHADIGNSKTEITIESILQAPTEKDAIDRISKCLDHTILKVAKIYLKDQGKHKLVTKVENRIRSLPMR